MGGYSSLSILLFDDDTTFTQEQAAKKRLKRPPLES